MHSVGRPVRRAVASVFRGLERTDVRASVICHGVAVEAIAAELDGIGGDRVRLLPCDAPFPSPALPVNMGISAATGTYVSRLDSDDEFEPGAVDAWMAVARARDAQIVIAPLRPAGGPVTKAPLTRPFRRGRLSPVSDRLSYRTAPFGLIRRDLGDALGARYTEDLSSGEDLDYGLRLWFGADRIEFAADAPAYLVHADAADRTTGIARSIAQLLEPSLRVVQSAWFEERSSAERRAIAIKLVRVHVLAAVRQSSVRNDADASSAAQLIAVLDEKATGWQLPFSRSDARVIEAIRHGNLADASRLVDQGSRDDRLFAPTIAGTLHRESTLRRYLRYRLPR
ncbi:glycosyltransferase family A protein [Microbacterium sp. M28]|uniref:glycosyltransferase family A protein n=1 Tax=Microbacterium sp. M28 TaxID=2962064 RepID=UPI0039A59A2E